MIAQTPKQIALFSELALKGALKLEIAGMTRRGMSAAELVRRKIGSTTRLKTKLLAEYEAWIKAKYT